MKPSSYTEADRALLLVVFGATLGHTIVGPLLTVLGRLL